ncbi:MAG: TonB-dependent receptor [Acidobacteriia bacterium]|nr:TonB-dependent receptor [Terriglobia bacterium]
MCSPLAAQGTQVAEILGRVTDSTGLGIPGAQITVTNTATGAMRSVVTSPDGSYALPNLPVGSYRLDASKEGFTAYAQSGIVLQVNTNPEINVVLNVGTVNEKVVVDANAAMVETHSNGVGQVIDQDRVVDLPLNGRQVTQLVTLSGGAVNFVPSPVAGQSLLSNKNYPTVSAFSVAGGQGGQTLFMLDGAPHMDPVSNIGLPMPFPDAIQEFKVEMSSLPANYGSQPGGVVNVVTRSGGNSFHGDAFEFLRNYDVNARNFFAARTDGLKRNQFGGDAGGPVLKNRLFFFGGYQGTYESLVPSANIAYVETAATLQGDFTQMASPACNGNRTITLGAPFVNNQVSPTLFSPVALNLLKLIPVSSDPCGKLTFGIPNRDHENQYVGRGDYQLNDKHSLFARYFITDFQHSPYFTNNLLTMSTDASVGLSDIVQSAVVGHTFIINPNTISSFRAAFSRSAVTRFDPPGAPTPQSLGANVTSPIPNYIYIPVSNYFTPMCTNCSPGPWISTDYQLSGELSMIRGPHQIALGVNAMNSRLNSYSNFIRNGSYTFTGQITGNALADLMLGKPISFSQNNGQIGDERLYVPSLYAQDNYRLNPHLSINAGIRWDPFTAPSSAVPQVSIFDPGWYNAGVHSTVFPNAPAGTLFVGDKGMPGNHYYFGRMAEFAPRIGLVYDPRGKGQETIRAGYGIFYGASPLWLQSGTHAPFAFPVSIPTPAGGIGNPYAGSTYGVNPFPLPNPLPADINFPLFGTGLGNFLLHPKPTYMEQWNIAIQKQFRGDWLLSVTYLGNRTVHLEYPDPLNPVMYIPGTCSAGQYGLTASGPCSTTGNENYRRILYLANPMLAQDYGALTLFGDSGVASYNGLLLSAQHRFTHNYTVLANYTWSHCLDDAEVGLNGAAAFQNPYNRNAEYANCAADVRQVFNLSTVARAPRLASRWGRRIVGEWRFSPIFTAQSGFYATVTDGVDNSLTGVTDRPNLIGNPSLPVQNTKEWFNIAAFAKAPTGQFGNLGRSTIEGPGAWNLDAALSRSFPVTERHRIDFRAEAFNVLNHARFGNPITTLSSGQFGQIITAGSPRIMQFALKYKF